MNKTTYVLLLGLIACNGSPQTAVKSEEKTPASTEPTTPKNDGALVGIEIKVQDYQVFHPFSRTRALLNANSPTVGKKKKRGLAKTKDSFGAGLVVDATNTSPHLLSAPDLLGEFVIKGKHGTVRCELDPKRNQQGRGGNHLSYDPRSKNEWRDESKQTYEKVWRPGETIRLRVREDCGNFFVYDTELESITTSFKVEARSMLHPGNPELTFPLNDPDAPLVRSETMSLALPPASLILQKVQIGEEWAHAAGDVVLRWDGARMIRDSLGNLGERADTLTRSDLPAAMEPSKGGFDELQFKTTSTKLIHWTDNEQIGKGRRMLDVETQITLNTDALKTRLEKGLDTSTPQAQTAVTRGINSETARLKALVPCNRILLVTTKRDVMPSNGAEATGACSQISGDTAASLRLRYNLGRYEVPVGLILRTRTQQQFIPIAHQSLISFDPR